MESDLLLKEGEFYKENDMLESKSREIFQRVNEVLKIQDDLLNDTFKTKVDLIKIQNSNFKLNPNDADVKREQLCGSPRGINEIAGNGVVRAFNTNLKCAIAAKERLQFELKQKLEELKTLQKENQSLKEDKEKWFLSYSSSKTNIAKLENQITNLKATLQSKDAENIGLKKEVENWKKQFKNASVKSNNCEVRLSRAAEEVNNLKAILTQCKDEEKDLKTTYKKQQSELALAVKQLEKQKQELLSGFKKQMKLIKLLMDQKVYLEALRIADMSESEYLKILDWKFN